MRRLQVCAPSNYSYSLIVISANHLCRPAEKTFGIKVREFYIPPSFNEDCSSVVGIKQYTSSKTLTKTFNIMGRETTFKPNTLLINVYDDGSAEKVFTKGTLNN